MKVILMMASTLDGKIAKHANDIVDWTSSEDKKKFRKATEDCGAVIMGSKTYETFGYPLPNRFNVVMTRDMLKEESHDNLMITAQTPKDILEMLKTFGYKKAALIGGSIVNSLFLKENLIDEIQITVSPKIFGSGVSIFNNDHGKNDDFKIKSVIILNEEIIITYIKGIK